jgi:hypothetical protein
VRAAATYDNSRVLKNPGNPKMVISKLSTPCVKTGFLPNLLSRLGRDKSEGAQAVENAFFNSLLGELASRAHQRSEAERANESARCVQSKESGTCAAERNEANKSVTAVSSTITKLRS